MSQLFTSGGQSIGVSASASVFSMNIQGWFSFRINWFDCLAVQGTLKSLLQHHSSKASSSVLSLLYDPTLLSTDDYWKEHKFYCATFVGKVISLLFNTLSRFVIAFLPRNNCLPISFSRPNIYCSGYT